MARFAAIPNIPTGSEMADWQSNLLAKVVENTELLTGLRGESDSSSKAITKGDVAVNQIGLQNLTNPTALGNGFTITISGTDYVVASLVEFVKLITDVQTLADDLAETRATLDILISQLRT